MLYTLHTELIRYTPNIYIMLHEMLKNTEVLQGANGLPFFCRQKAPGGIPALLANQVSRILHNLFNLLLSSKHANRERR